MTDHLVTVFALRRSMETGKLELDCYLQFDYADLKLQQATAQAVAALDDKVLEPWMDPMSSASQAISGMKIRAKCDGAIVGLYGWKGSAVMDRQEFWEHHKDWPLSKYKQFRI